jgi:hypothetical protein
MGWVGLDDKRNMRMYYGPPGFLDRGYGWQIWVTGLSIDPAQRELPFGVHDTRLRRVRVFGVQGLARDTIISEPDF